MVTEEQIQRTVSTAEKSFEDCWEKLTTVKDAAALFSFQPILLAALYQIESAYQTICREGKELIGKKPRSDKKQFSERMQTLNRYKSVLNQVFDIGKVLGDAFAWLFYFKETQLLKSHHDHQFIPHLALGVGGRGEYEFFKNTPRFGRYFVLAHSITTFLRQGDVSLIDPIEMKVVAIGELKSKKKSKTEISVAVSFIGKKLPKEMLPRIPDPQGEPAKFSDQFPQQLMERFKRQVKEIHDGFKPETLDRPPQRIEMRLLEMRLKELFDRSSVGEWGDVKVDRGLFLIGIKSEQLPLYAQLKGEALMDGKSFQQNLESLKDPVNEIFDKKLPHNAPVVSSILYPANDRYFLPYGMKPFFWWPLNKEICKAMVFQKFRVMSVWNPAFLIDELKQSGFDVQFDKDRKLKIVKQINAKRVEVSGLDHFVGAVRTQFFADSSIVSFVCAAAEKIEAENFQQPTHISVDLDFLHD